jgi:hypothetical protein
VRAFAAACAVLVLAAAAADGAVRGRALKGRSSQGLAVTLGRPSNGVRSFSYRARLDCSDGTSFTEGRFADLVRPRRGAFTVRHTSDRGATRTAVSGRIRGSRARGTLSVVERYAAVVDSSGAAPLDPRGPVVCTSGTVRWTAR